MMRTGSILLLAAIASAQPMPPVAYGPSLPPEPVTFPHRLEWTPSLTPGVDGVCVTCNDWSTNVAATVTNVMLPLVLGVNQITVTATNRLASSSPAALAYELRSFTDVSFWLDVSTNAAGPFGRTNLLTLRDPAGEFYVRGPGLSITKSNGVLGRTLP
jgi:hypothetical protein